MKVLQLTKNQLLLLEGRAHLIVESQEYGQLEDWRYNVVMNDMNATQIIVINPQVRLIKDSGRTIGFWQRIGRGVYRPDLVATQGFDEKLTAILSKCRPATFRYSGKTWKAILKSINLKPEYVESIGLLENDKKRSPKKTKATK